MSKEIDRLLDKAARSNAVARTLFQTGHIDFAATRAYYAMFYAATALLVAKGLRFRKHTAVHVAFGEHFAKTGAIDARYHRWLLDAFDQRMAGDYDANAEMNSEAVALTVDRAAEFIEVVERYLAEVPNA